MLDSISQLFVIMAAVGVGLFLIGLIFDGVLDSTLSLIFSGFGAFMAGAGASTLIFKNVPGVDLPIAIGLGAVVGAGLVVFLLRLILAARNSENLGRQVDFSKLAGSEASIIWWEDTHGDVLVEFSGQRIKVAAESDEKLEGPTVQVESFTRNGDLLELVKVKALSKLTEV